MKKMKLKIAITGLVIVALIGGTLAYFNQTLTAINPFDTGHYNTTLVETFKPSDGVNWEPGVEINKDVEVVNTGDQPVVVRVKFDEVWSRPGDIDPFKEIFAEDDSENPLAVVPGDKAVYNEYQASETDGLTELDDTVVTKNLISEGWTFNPLDGWWYYNTTLAPYDGVTTNTDTTGIFLDSVELIGDLDIGFYSMEKYYTEMTDMPDIQSYIPDIIDPLDAVDGWVLYTSELPLGATHSISVAVLDDMKMGYSDAEYELTITIQTVQATTGAVENAFTQTLVQNSTTPANYTYDSTTDISWNLMVGSAN